MPENTTPSFTVQSPTVTYSPGQIVATAMHTVVRATTSASGTVTATPRTHAIQVTTSTAVPRVGLMLVGWGGNNGSTLTGGLIANKLGLSWETKEGVRHADWLGSLTQASTVRVGEEDCGKSVYVRMADVLPTLRPEDIVLGGWDISGKHLAVAMRRAQVFDIDLQRQLAPHMAAMRPLPSVYDADFIALNQADRADNTIGGTRAEQLERLRGDIRTFKATNALDRVFVLWTANTERFVDVIAGVNDTPAALLAAIEKNDCTHVSPSMLFAVAAVLENAAYINGSPQNTLVPGVTRMAEERGVFVAGDDFKSGQTKMKSVLVDFLVGAGIRPTSIVSYNHLGNNDGKNLSAPAQFRSKEISKSNVVDDIVASNHILYPDPDVNAPDHVVVIKYVPYVGDSKRALDEYTSEIFMGGRNTISIHNTCEDSLLATPLILDLIVLAELAQRMVFSVDGGEPEHMHPVLSLLSYLLKAPVVPEGAPVINALNSQRAAIVNVMRMAVGLPAEDHMLLEHRIPSLMASTRSLAQKQRL